MPELTADGTPEQQAANATMCEAMGPTAAAMDAGNLDAAAESAVEALLGLGEGGFAKEPAAVQAIPRDNAPSFVANWNAAEPTAITCEQLGTVRVPTLVVIGSATLPASV